MSASVLLLESPTQIEVATETERAIVARVAERIRAHEEAYYRDDDGTPPNMVGVCKVVSLALLKALKQEGLDARAVFGMYMDCEDGYPELVDCSGHGISPEDDLDDWDNSWTHWWVVYKNLIIDLTADQFHPSEAEAYRIVITSVGDPDYSV